jgi:hypothetical protein
MAFLNLLPDILLLAATIGLAVLCRGLARRQTDAGELRARVETLAEELARLRDRPEAASTAEPVDTARLEAVLASADDRIGRLEMLLDSLEDIEEQAPAPASQSEVMPDFRTNRRIGGASA